LSQILAGNLLKRLKNGINLADIYSFKMIKHKTRCWYLITLGIFLMACNKPKESVATKDTLAIGYTVRTQWVHDTQAFIEGLEINDGKLYESTGQEGQSWVGIIDISTGKPDKKIILDKQYFGEGITILNNKIYQLTWKNNVGFIYDLKTFKKIREFTYDTIIKEGWGMTHDSRNLILSNGTENLIYLDTTTLKPVRTIRVTNEYGPVKNLNELEFVEGFIFANEWQTNRVLKIDPQTGKVVGRLDLTPLVNDTQMRNPRADVLNGIAYHPTTKLFLVTGKHWPMFYVLQLNKKSIPPQ
jgi:glutamine cyclotransferase